MREHRLLLYVTAGLGLGLGLVLGGCAKNLPYTVTQGKTNPPPLTGELLSGRLLGTDDQPVELANLRAAPVVVVFSQDTCSVCRAEAREMRAALADPSRPPARVRLITVLVGATIDDARDWQADNAVPWTVATDDGDALFRQSCPERTVPCTLVQLPGQGVIFRKNGQASVAELVSRTGDWENP